MWIYGWALKHRRPEFRLLLHDANQTTFQQCVGSLPLLAPSQMKDPSRFGFHHPELRSKFLKAAASPPSSPCNALRQDRFWSSTPQLADPKSHALIDVMIAGR
jgi:hypothetical protein